MNKPRILYYIEEPNHKRMFSNLNEDRRVVQMIAVLSVFSVRDFKLNTQNIVPGRVRKDMLRLLDKFKPNVFIQCNDSEIFRDDLKKRGIKHAYINHGIWPHSPNNIARVAQPFWCEFDMYFGGSIMFKELFEKYSTTKNPIFINTLPQFDVLYNIKDSKSRIIKKTARKSRAIKATSTVKIITLFSHDCKNRESITPFNEGFYRVAIELGRLAKKYNWKVYIKVKKDDINYYLHKNKEPWAAEIKKDYALLDTNRYVEFVRYDANPYSYLCSDAVIVSARSTIEIEAALMKTPLIKMEALRPNPNQDLCDKYEIGTKQHNAAYFVNDMKNFEETVKRALYGDNTRLFNNQEAFINAMGIKFDGKAQTRIIDAICGIYGVE